MTKKQTLMLLGAGIAYWWLWGRKSSAAQPTLTRWDSGVDNRTGTPGPGMTWAKVGGKVYNFTPVVPGDPSVPQGVVGTINVNGRAVAVDRYGATVGD